MSEYDLHNNVTTEIALVQETITAATTNGLSIDTKTFESLEYVITAATITAGTFTFRLEQSDDFAFTSPETVPVDEVLGNVHSFVPADSDKTARIGSIGKRQFQRIVVLGADSQDGTFNISAVHGNPQSAPTTNIIA